MPTTWTVEARAQHKGVPVAFATIAYISNDLTTSLKIIQKIHSVRLVIFREYNRQFQAYYSGAIHEIDFNPASATTDDYNKLILDMMLKEQP